MRIEHLALQDIYAAKLGRRGLPAALADLVCSSRHDIFRTTHHGISFLIPAVLLIEALWLWSASAATQLMVPASLDLNVGRMTGAQEIIVQRSFAGRKPSTTTLRRIAWLSQCEDARRSWSSVLTHARNGRISIDLPSAHLSAWAWGVETFAGLLVSDFNGAVLDFDLPSSDALLRVAGTETRVPGPSEPANGFMSFL